MNLWIGLLFVVGFIGCARVVVPPPPPVVTPLPPPHFEKTFGSVQVLAGAGLSIQYKKIALLIDPLSAPAETDYVFLTGRSNTRWTSLIQSNARKNMKILCSPALLLAISNASFTQAKSLESGHRLLLKKETEFLFANAAAGQSYLLEFDNGKNIFVAGDISNPDALREFVYALRDDGREIEIGFFSAGAKQDTAQLAQIIGLLQPKNAILLSDDTSKFSDMAALQEKLKAEFFEGSVVVAGSDSIVF